MCFHVTHILIYGILLCLDTTVRDGACVYVYHFMILNKFLLFSAVGTVNHFFPLVTFKGSKVL